VPDEVEFATKPALARQMITRALDAGVPARWVAADEVYGGDPTLRGDLERRAVGYVLAVACDHRVDSLAVPLRADHIAATGRRTRPVRARVASSSPPASTARRPAFGRPPRPQRGWLAAESAHGERG
jgi:SRSO17 transposase